MSQAKIVLMACGSFNPPTPMHLRMFEIARDYMHSMGLGKVIGGIISPVNDSYGKKDLAAAKHRCAMLKLALRSSDWIKLSDWEVNQENWIRTRISLQHHQDQLNHHSESHEAGDTGPSWLPDDILNLNSQDQLDNVRSNMSDNPPADYDNYIRCETKRVKLKLLCGADLLESFSVPGLWAEEDLESILGNHGLVVISRGASQPESFINDSDLLTKFRRNITIVTNWICNEVSSTSVRRLLRRGESLKYLIDDPVISYIQQNKLYGCIGGCSEDVEYVLEHHNAKYFNNMPKNKHTYVKNPKKRNRSKSDIKPSYAEIAAKPRSSYVKQDINKVRSVTDLTVDNFNFDFSKRRVSMDERVVNMNYLSVNDAKTDKNVKSQVRGVDSSRRASDLSNGISKFKNGGSAQLLKSKSECTDLNNLLKLRERNCENIVKLVLTQHGIQVISDWEAIV